MSPVSSNKLVGSAACALAIGLGPASLNAELITFEFAGHINYMEGDLAFLGGSIQIGMPFSGSYTFESTTPDAAYLDPNVGEYAGALVSFSVDVGNHSLMGVNTINRINVGDNPDPEGQADVYLVGDGATPLAGRSVEMGIILLDYSAMAISGDSLPLSPPPLGLFDETKFLIIDAAPFSRFSINGEITTLVPEPSFLVVIVFAAMLLRFPRLNR